MENQKKIYFLSILFSLLVFVVNIVLFLTKISRLWIFILLLTLSIFSISIFVYLFIMVSKKIKRIKIENKSMRAVGDYNIDLYEILGIPIQYNEDGSVKNIYELLDLEPVYDDNGNRILTVYELLKIMPKFDDSGKEIPSVFVIKNKVKRPAKVDLSSRVLTRKLSEEEKEQLAIKEALMKKLKEAEEQGDKKSQEAIKKIVNNNKKEQSKDKGKSKSKSKELTFSLGKAASGVGFNSVKETMKIDLIDRVSEGSLSVFSIERNKKDAVKKETNNTQNTDKIKNPNIKIDKDLGKKNLTSISVKVMFDEEERSL